LVESCQLATTFFNFKKISTKNKGLSDAQYYDFMSYSWESLNIRNHSMAVARNIRNLRLAPFHRMHEYLTVLRDLSAEPAKGEDWERRCFAALNGEASGKLQKLVSIRVRRRFGAFFTGAELSTRLLSLGIPFDTDTVIYDPACGMGNLLLSAANELPLSSTLSQTLKNWGRQISGTDLHSEFVEGTKTRLLLLARKRHGAMNRSNGSANEYFPNIRVANGLRDNEEFRRATHIFMNPPFSAVRAPKRCAWASGRVSAAAMFTANSLEFVRAETQIFAVLPEVLRSGTFSENWRRKIDELAEVRLVEPYGVFDEHADVDVFLLRLARRKSSAEHRKFRWPPMNGAISKTVKDHFEVHVGRVVPHRDKSMGPEYPYIHPRCLPPWEVMTEFTETRKHKGEGYLPPFVAIRRTSRPDQPYRATATVVRGKGPVAVENHLLVCQPNDAKLATCLELMKQLKTRAVNDYLNSRIRCRHLTVGAVSDIPFEMSR
jgi:hypothetical protein